MSISSNPITLEQVRAALALADFDAEPAQMRMSPIPRRVLPEYRDIPLREAGGLILLYPGPDGLLHIVLTRRTHTPGDPHSGQISFPGGRCDPADESFTATALRETCEELGICDGVAVLGQLSPTYIPPSHYRVYPTVGSLVSEPVFCPNPVEVAEVFSLALDDLLNDQIKHAEDHEWQGRTVTVPYYWVQGRQVWGATAVMLSEFEHRLRAVLV